MWRFEAVWVAPTLHVQARRLTLLQEPQSPVTRLGGRGTAANVAFDDHASDKRFSDRIDTVTVDSVFSGLSRAGLGNAPVRLR